MATAFVEHTETPLSLHAILHLCGFGLISSLSAKGAECEEGGCVGVEGW